MLSRGQVERAERDVNAIMARIHETVKKRRQNRASWQEWEEAARALHTYKNPVFLLWNKETLDLVRAGDRNAIEGALAFLEADPYFFRSGYLKEKVLHAIKRAPWTRRDEVRLQAVILRTLEGRAKREFPFYTRLISRLRTPQFEADLRAAAKRARCPNHARLALIALDGHC